MHHHGVIEGRELYRDGELTLQGYMLPDIESSPHDADCYTGQDVMAWHAGMWAFVTMVVDVEWNGVAIASGVLGAVEHGDLSGGTADAWELVPALEAETDDSAVVQGSALSSVVDEAVSAAQAFAVSAISDPATVYTSPLGQAVLRAQSWTTRLD
jgi:hypothetical protein